MSYVTNLICRECGAEYKTQPLNVCEFCFGPLEIQYDFTKIKKDVSKKKFGYYESVSGMHLWKLFT